MSRVATLAAVPCALAWCAQVRAQDLVFRGSDFEVWSHPRGLVNVRPDGVEVKRFGGAFNAVANAHEFSSSVIGEHGLRPEWAPSNQADAYRVTDQDPTTWWRPAPDDPLQKWWLEVDLGRAVVATKVRVLFPDTTGARPFAFFSVFASPGLPVWGGTVGGRVVFNRVGRPVNSNSSRVVEFDLKTTGLWPAIGQNMVDGETLDFDIIRFVRFEAAGRSPDAALAEIEVDGVGFNLSGRVATRDRVEKGQPQWGGRTWTSEDRVCSGCGRGSGAEGLVDEDLGQRWWAIWPSGKDDWRDNGIWSVVDLGNTFRVDRIVWLPLVWKTSPFLYGFEDGGWCAWEYFDFLTSDGRPSRTADPEVEGPYEYELLSQVDNNSRWLQWRHLFDFQFPSRQVRLVLWRNVGYGGLCRALQLFVFHSEGYPARVELESADIPLGGARSIRRVEWDADVPPGTRVEVETQTGGGYQTVTRYFLSNGKQAADLAAYMEQKERNRGPIVEEQVRDASWSSWSEAHRISGQAFLSPSPRQWLRARLRLISDDPEAMPRLRSLTFVASPPVIQAGLVGRVWPREAPLDSLQDFVYAIEPVGSSPGDPGFDQVLIALPVRGGDAELASTTVGGRQVAGKGEVRSDSLVVQLPPPAVLEDSVEVCFRTRLYQSPTAFAAVVRNSALPDNGQGVVPVAFGADQVFVPEAEVGGRLIRHLTHTRFITPNADGVNDEYELSFTVVKTDRPPRVRIYSLDGREVAQLANQGRSGERARYLWSGRSGGRLVPPGLYLVRIEVPADVGDQSVDKLVQVAY